MKVARIFFTAILLIAAFRLLFNALNLPYSSKKEAKSACKQWVWEGAWVDSQNPNRGCEDEILTSQFLAEEFKVKLSGDAELLGEKGDWEIVKYFRY
jgi:hypothetical protein